MSPAASRPSLLARIMNWLGGSEPSGDPDQPVEVALVDSFQGPLLSQVLARSGIRCTPVEVYDGATGLERTSLRVPRADFDAASRVLAEHRRV